MNKINDYFLLFHGNEQKHSDALDINHTINDDTFFEISALILSVKRDNFEKISLLESFHTLIQELSFVKITTLELLYHLQYSVIKHFIEHRSRSNIEHFHKSFEYLQDENIISKESCVKLISLFEPQIEEEKELLLPEKKSEADEDFHTKKAYLVTVINELKRYFTLVENLEKIESYLHKQKFSIGITGVMNAGKSTMLNALMGKEILGTNVIPETANLSIVKYSDKSYAKVTYWSKSEWAKIEKSALSNEAIHKFVAEVKEKFSSNLEEYIKESSYSETIDVAELSEYTSASSQSTVYQLVKSVEIGSDLAFLKNGIEIVDTPGLDDIVVQREEITKEYVSECDLMIHLMNVSQSATLKDVAFIVDSILYQNISKVLIVITRADSVTPKEVDEVVEYTKLSIAKHLQEHNSNSKLDYILDNLHFIALSGKMALFHRVGREDEALSAGYTLEKSGILELEAYLQETLFSDKNERSRLLIESAKKSLKREVESELNSLKLEVSMLHKNESELETLLEELQEQKERALRVNSRIKIQIDAYEDELKLFLTTQLQFLENEMRRLEDIIKERIMSEAHFSFEKDRVSPSVVRLKKIVDDGLKHGVLDIIREFRYKFLKQSKRVLDALKANNSALVDEEIRIENLFDDAFKKGFLTTNHDALSEHLSKLFSKSSLKKLLSIELEVATLIKDELHDLDDLVKSRAQELSRDLLRDFFMLLKTPMQKVEKKFEDDELLIKEHIEKVKNDAISRTTLAIEINKKIKTIELIVSRCN